MAAQAAGPADLSAWQRPGGDGRVHLDLLVPGIHCAGCMRRIENGLNKEPGVAQARVNLSTKRLALEWDPAVTDGGELIGKLKTIGFEARPFLPEEAGEAADKAQGRELLKALAVAGFAAANVMLLSVSVWSGADAATRDLFHWISALIALPAIVYAGRPFFRSAWAALAGRHLNMDVPISLAVIVAGGMSLYETVTHGPHAYFDASVSLLFFLLAGRYLDQMMRSRARSAVSQLLSLSAQGATIVDDDGSTRFVKASDIVPGMRALVAAGERVPADGRVIDGASDLDRSIVTGESVPEAIGAGAVVQAGTLNLTGPVTIAVTAVGDDTFLGEIVRLMEAAEQSKARYVRIADRAAGIYAPAVHAAAALTFVGWLVWSGDWHLALLTAIAVLIITCPCALGLAVPAVQVVASGRLFERGVLVKDGSALERIASVDTVVFDKTGTLTTNAPRLLPPAAVSTAELGIALGLARLSRHPLSRALAAALGSRSIEPAAIETVIEVPGQGLEGRVGGKVVRIGHRDWCGYQPAADDSEGLPELCLAVAGNRAKRFTFEDELRPDAAAAIAELKRRGLRVAIVSGDREAAVARVARAVGIEEFKSGWKPQDKAAYIAGLQNAGRKVLMVGDGINDAPALASAQASIAPATASDIGRTMAGFVFLGDGLDSIIVIHDVARAANRLVAQNFALAALYNAIAVPTAVAGLVTPLIAALAMSLSSVVVVSNALRLRLVRVGLAGAGGRSRPRPAAVAGGDEKAHKRAA